MNEASMEDYNCYSYFQKIYSKFEDWSSGILKKFSAGLKDPEEINERLDELKQTKSGIKLQYARYNYLKSLFGSKYLDDEAKLFISEAQLLQC